MFVSHQKSKLFVLSNYGWILDFEFYHLWRKLSYRSLVRSPIETSVLSTRGTCVFIFLLSVCNVLLPLECAVKFWHSACFILNFWDNFCNFLCKIKYGSIRLIKKAWSMVIIFIRKNQHILQICDFSEGYEEWKCLSRRKSDGILLSLRNSLDWKLNIDKTELMRVSSSQQLSANGTESLCLGAKKFQN